MGKKGADVCCKIKSLSFDDPTTKSAQTDVIEIWNQLSFSVFVGLYVSVVSLSLSLSSSNPDQWPDVTETFLLLFNNNDIFVPPFFLVSYTHTLGGSWTQTLPSTLLLQGREVAFELKLNDIIFTLLHINLRVKICRWYLKIIKKSGRISGGICFL